MLDVPNSRSGLRNSGGLDGHGLRKSACLIRARRGAGEVINRGISVVIFGIALGVLTEISRQQIFETSAAAALCQRRSAV